MTVEPERSDRNDELDAVLATIDREVRAHRVRFYALIAVWFAIGAVSALSNAEPGGLRNASLLFFVLWIFSPILAAIPSRRLREATRRLAESDEPELAGPLIDMSGHFLPMSTGQAVRNARNSSLRKLSPEHRGRFTSRQMGWLHATVREYGMQKSATIYLEATEAALCALEQVGDERAIPAVRRIAAHAPKGPDQERIRRKAEDCIAAIEARAASTAASRTLLRPSSGNTEEAATLLRYAATTATNDENLLQPGEKPV